jgi:Holliday junction DNA helicase RuvA
MITFLEGTLVEKHPTRAVLNVGGVGYEVFIPLSSYDRLPAVNQTCRILTHDHVREDTHVLFGFMSDAERRMFLLLMTISGIGPKLAISALSGLSVRELKRAIIEGDVKRLSSISGIGKKTAERLVVELKDKFDAGEALEAVAGPAETPGDNLKARDAILALIALGYKQEQAGKMVMEVVRRTAGQDLSVEEIIKHALGA